MNTFKWMITSRGYVSKMDYFKTRHYLHRFIMNYHGIYAEMFDHINRNKKDNRISNLRNTNQSINNLNKPRNKGVRKQRKRYEARIGKWRASYSSEQEAIEAYERKKKELLV